MPAFPPLSAQAFLLLVLVAAECLSLPNPEFKAGAAEGHDNHHHHHGHDEEEQQPALVAPKRVQEALTAKAEELGRSHKGAQCHMQKIKFKNYSLFLIITNPKESTAR